jgi:TadE-like protein
MRNVKRNRRDRLRIADLGLRNGVSNGPIQSESRSPQSAIDDRRGAVAVEFAVVAPILLAIVLGMVELGRAFEAQNLLEVAAREGARFASMDRDDLIGPGESANEKMIQDVKTFLESNGIPADEVTVAVKDHENPSNDFDLDDPENDLKLFEVQVSVDWSAVSLTPVGAGQDSTMTATVVFRNGRATISN